MNRLARSALYMVVFFTLTSCTINRITEKPRTIKVTGQATCDIFASKRTLDFVCITGGWSAVQICADNDAIVGRFLEKVRALGVTNADIDNQAVCTVTNPGQSYEARRVVKITISDESKIPSIVDCKTTSIRLRGVSYEFASDTVSEIRRLRTAAIQNASEIAALQAGAAGARLGSLCFVGDEAITTIDTDSDKTGKKTLTATIAVSYDLVQ